MREWARERERKCGALPAGMNIALLLTRSFIRLFADCLTVDFSRSCRSNTLTPRVPFQGGLKKNKSKEEKRGEPHLGVVKEGAGRQSKRTRSGPVPHCSLDRRGSLLRMGQSTGSHSGLKGECLGGLLHVTQLQSPPSWWSRAHAKSHTLLSF